MKKGLLFIVLVLSMLCLVSCKGKEKILETNSSNVLLDVEDENLTVEDIFNNLDKYGTGKETPNKLPIFQVKYAKTIFYVYNKYNIRANINFGFSSQNEIETMEKYVENFNENLDKNNVYVGFIKNSELKDGTEYMIYDCSPKKHLVKSMMPEKYRDKL